MNHQILWCVLVIAIESYAIQYPYRKKMGSPADVQEHKTIQQEFLRLQRQAGIKTMPEVINMQRRMRAGNPLATQAQFNQLRTELNQLFNQPTLNFGQIQQKINKLRSLNPGRWPFPRDYEVLLRARTVTTAPVASVTPAVMPTAAEQSEKIQQDFKALKEQLGLSTSADQMTKVYPSPALPGSQQQLNLVRMELNRMLSKPALDDYDMVKIKQRIDELASLNPPRFPRAQDYQEVFELRQ